MRQISRRWARQVWASNSFVGKTVGASSSLTTHAASPPEEQVIFASYIHEHLSEKSTEEVPRLRFYTCANCDEPVKNRGWRWRGWSRWREGRNPLPAM